MMGDGDVQVMSAHSHRIRGVAGVGTIELVYVGGLFTMGGGSSIL